MTSLLAAQAHVTVAQEERGLIGFRDPRLRTLSSSVAASSILPIL